MHFDPPKTTGRLRRVRRRASTQRADDNEETVRNRLAVYRAQTEPLVDYYRQKDVLGEAHGGGKLPDEVFAEVRQLLDAASDRPQVSS